MESTGQETNGEIQEIEESPLDGFLYSDPQLDGKIFELARKYVQDIQQTDNSITGFIDGKDVLDEFIVAFCMLCSNSFPVRDSKGWCKPKNKNEIASHKSKLLWKLSSGVMPIPCFYMPFLVEGYLVRDCINGGMSNKCKQNLQKRVATMNSNVFVEPAKKLTRISKKLGCPASIKIKQITIFPDFKVEPSHVKSAKGLRKLKEGQLRKLRCALQTPQNVKCITRFCIEIPKTIAHSHHVPGNPVLNTFNVMAINQIIKHRLQELISLGVYELKEIKAHLKAFMQTEIFKNIEFNEFDIDERKFFPPDKDIKHHVESTLKHISEVNEKKKMLIGELQHIASWACKCSDTDQLNLLVDKITDLQKDFSMHLADNLTGNLDLTHDAQHITQIKVSPVHQDFLSPPEKIVEQHQEILTNIQHEPAELHDTHQVEYSLQRNLGKSSLFQNNVAERNITETREHDNHDYIISNIEVETNETAESDVVCGDVLYTVVESNGQVYLHASH